MNVRKKSRFWVVAWVLFLGTPLGIVFDAQAQAPPTPEEPKNDLRYGTEQPANSGFALEAHTMSSWDNNLLGDNTHRVGDYVFQEGGLLDFWTRHPGWSLELGYR